MSSLHFLLDEQRARYISGRTVHQVFLWPKADIDNEKIYN